MERMTDAAGLEPVDADALRRCLDLMAADPEWSEFIASKLRNSTWFEAASFAAYSLQADALGLRPWQTPPAMAGDPAAAALVRRLRAAGLSRYEPDPLAALAKAERPAPKRPRP
jgi:hypothetical protein